MSTATIERALPAPPQPRLAIVRPLRLENGEAMDQPTFHAIYETMPEHVRAELIEGRVHMASPLFEDHAWTHNKLLVWLDSYEVATPGTQMLNNASVILGPSCEVQPDALLRVRPEFGGATWRNDAGWICGAPEFAFEVASSSASHDLGPKLRDYERHGVREYAVHAILQGQVFWWVRRGDRFEPLPAGPDGVFHSEVFPGLWLDAAALVANDSPRLRAVLARGLATPEHAAFVTALAQRRQG